MAEFWCEALMNELPWVSRIKSALTRVQTKVVEVGEVLSCVLTWVVEVARFPSWEIVVVAEAVMISCLAAFNKKDDAPNHGHSANSFLGTITPLSTSSPHIYYKSLENTTK